MYTINSEQYKHLSVNRFCIIEKCENNIKNADFPQSLLKTIIFEDDNIRVKQHTTIWFSVA